MTHRVSHSSSKRRQAPAPQNQCPSSLSVGQSLRVWHSSPPGPGGGPRWTSGHGWRGHSGSIQQVPSTQPQPSPTRSNWVGYGGPSQDEGVAVDVVGVAVSPVSMVAALTRAGRCADADGGADGGASGEAQAPNSHSAIIADLRRDTPSRCSRWLGRRCSRAQGRADPCPRLHLAHSSIRTAHGRRSPLDSPDAP